MLETSNIVFCCVFFGHFGVRKCFFSRMRWVWRISLSLMICRWVNIFDRIGVIYLGKLVEVCSSDELYAHTIYPYTKALLSTIPIRDSKLTRSNKRINLKGDVTSPIGFPVGCWFFSRCPITTERCLEEDPQLHKLESGHFKCCHNMWIIGNIHRIIAYILYELILHIFRIIELYGS